MQLHLSFLLFMAILSLSCTAIQAQDVATTILFNMDSKKKCSEEEIAEIQTALLEDAKSKAAGAVRRNLCDNEGLCGRFYSGVALHYCVVYGWFCRRRELSQTILDSEWDQKVTKETHAVTDPELVEKCHEQLASIESIILKTREDKGKGSNCGKHLNKDMKFTCFVP